MNRTIILCDAANGFYKGYNHNAFMAVMRIKAEERYNIQHPIEFS